MPSHPRHRPTEALNGWRRRCPCCGEGPMMHDYWAVRAQCPLCDAPLPHQRSDNHLASLAALAVTLLVSGLMLRGVGPWISDPLGQVALLLVAAVLVPLYLFPRVRGLVIGLHWAARTRQYDSAKPQ